MTVKQKLIDQLLSSKGFRELDTPVIVTSGEFLTPFFCNTEFLFMDPSINEILSTHGNDPASIIDYAVARRRENPDVNYLFSILTEKAGQLLTGDKPAAISGGQRRDWLFSGPVAEALRLPHISIFKPDGKGEEAEQSILMDTPDGSRTDTPDLSGYQVLHIADLLTRGSSIYSVPQGSGKPSGWLPAVRNRGAELKNLLVVVSRSQGGEEMLEKQGLKTHSCIQIDTSFIRTYGTNRDSILMFLNTPVAWTERYLVENGIEILLPYIDDDPKKRPRLEKFMAHYRDFLDQMGWLEILKRRGVHEAA